MSRPSGDGVGVEYIVGPAEVRDRARVVLILDVDDRDAGIPVAEP
jgi:hypothetical protein